MRSGIPGLGSWLGGFRPGFWGPGFQQEGGPGTRFLALAARRGLSSRPGVGMPLWGLENAANNFTPAKGLLAAFLSRFPRATPLRIFSRSRGTWEPSGTKAGSSNPASKALVSQMLVLGSVWWFINDLGVLSKSRVCCATAWEVFRTGIKSV